MKKEKPAVRKKESKPAALPVVEEVKITEDTICIVTFNLLGAFKERQSNANTKEEIRKMKLSPILDENKKGRFICHAYGAPGRKLKPEEPLPRNYYVGPKVYKPYSEYKCTQRRVYSANALEGLSSPEVRPFRIGKKQWDTMSIKDRLMTQFAIDASSMNPINPGFTFEFVN